MTTPRPMTRKQADKLIRLATLTAAREAARLGDHQLATELFARCGISYVQFTSTAN